MTPIERSQQVLAHLLNSPEGEVYSIEVEELQDLMVISQQELADVVIYLRSVGYRINSTYLRIYGLKRIQMNQS